MNVVAHHDVRVQPIVPRGAVSVAIGTVHHFRGLRMTEVKRTTSNGVEKTVHGNESLSRSGRGGKRAVHRKASVEPPREKDGLT